ncbi:MAG: helix-turn-helix domain-containing GNAT family N-acetyltransferase [Acidobacteriota bacterium]
MPATAPLDRQSDAVRRFNRFYTRRIGVLEETLLRSPFSLAEVRLLYEIAHRDRPTAAKIRADLGLDRGYVSRLVGGLERRGLVRRRRSASDGRESPLSLTAAGRKAFEPLEAGATRQVAAMLETMPPSRRRALVDAMGRIEALLDPGRPAAATAPVRLRAPRPGDMGWVVHRHGALYAEEYGWDETFEALVGGIVSEFVLRFDPKRERCWIAERQGEILGSVFLVRRSAKVAKLRLLYVEPGARGLGIGAALVSACVDEARALGYERLVLWTQSVLSSARHLYVKAGFRLVREETHRSFGKDLVAETWELRLEGGSAAGTGGGLRSAGSKHPRTRRRDA